MDLISVLQLGSQGTDSEMQLSRQMISLGVLLRSTPLEGGD